MTPETRIQSLNGQLRDLVTQRARVKSKVSALGTKRDQMKGELTALTNKRDSINAELSTPLNTLATERDSIRDSVSSLEKRCGISGLNHRDVIGSLGASLGSSTQEDFEARLKDARSEAQRSEIIKEFQAACASGRLKARDGRNGS